MCPLAEHWHTIGAAELEDVYATQASDPLTVTRHYLDRIDAIDGAIHAYVAVTAETAIAEATGSAARWQAGRSLSRLDGVPIAVKANIAMAGLPWHAGIAAYRDRIAEQDAACVARLRAAGAVILGLTNMDEGALGAMTDNPWLGRTQNPSRPGFTAGGSSGGSAAAVAAQLCAAALGTDTMGSIRIPAAYCGVVGYMPTRGLIPLDGVVPLARCLDHIGVLGRTVADCALVAAIIADHPQNRPICEAQGLAVTDWLYGDTPVNEFERILAEAAGTAASLGLPICRVAPLSLDLDQLRLSALLLCERAAKIVHESALASDPGGFSDQFRRLLNWGNRQSPDAAIAAARSLAHAAQTIRSLSRGKDALLLPAVPHAAFRFDEPTPNDQSHFTLLANLAGCAAIVIAAGTSAIGLPLSVQLIGGNDARLLEIATSLEKRLKQNATAGVNGGRIPGQCGGVKAGQ